MSQTITISLPCIPPTSWGKNGKRPFTKNGRAWIVEKPETKNTKEWLYAELRKYAPEKPMTGPIRLDIIAVFPHPKSAPKKNQGRLMLKTTKPDRDAITSTVQDVLERLGFYLNDSQVAKGDTSKFNGPEPGILIEIEECSE